MQLNALMAGMSGRDKAIQHIKSTMTTVKATN